MTTFLAAFGGAAILAGAFIGALMVIGALDWKKEVDRRLKALEMDVEMDGADCASHERRITELEKREK